MGDVVVVVGGGWVVVVGAWVVVDAAVLVVVSASSDDPHAVARTAIIRDTRPRRRSRTMSRPVFCRRVIRIRSTFPSVGGIASSTSGERPVSSRHSTRPARRSAHG
jgi:hypothetical protein